MTRATIMRFTTAIGVSIALHGVLAVGIVLCMELAPGPTTVATLDLSSVELSFAEEDVETAALAPTMPAPPSEPPAPKEENPPEPETEKPDDLPPDPEAVKIPEPEIEHERMETPPPLSPPAPAVAPKQAKIDAPPKPKKAIRPEYPRGARQRGEQGDVVVEIRVSESGAVDSVSVVGSSGFAELDDAAVRAAKKARFTPAKSGGEAVASTARLTLTFRLR